MNIRTAILKAADHIEMSLGAYHFMSNDRPNPECGTQGCMAGWIGHFSDIETDNFPSYAHGVAIALGHSSLDAFLSAVRAANNDSYKYQGSGENAATALRFYADKYHPEPKATHTGIPSSVRELFNQPVQA